MKLIIAEKPSVAFAIAKALGVKGSKDGYIENKEFIITGIVFCWTVPVRKRLPTLILSANGSKLPFCHWTRNCILN